MHNYVLLYRFENNEAEKNFEQKVLKEFNRHKEITDAGHKYIGLAGGEEPAVVDSLNTILNEIGMGRAGSFDDNDYVALYFSRDKDPDNVKRQLLIGTAERVDLGAETMSADAHRNAVINLLNVNYIKEQPNQ